MIRFLISFFVILALFANCCTSKNRIDITAEIQKIRAADRAMLQAETQRDLEAAMTYFSEDAVFQPPNSSPVIGHDAIREFYGQLFNIPYSGVYCESDTIVVSKSGDMAYLIGISYYEFQTSDEMNRLEGKYITIWRKIEDKWLCVAVSWSGNEPSN